MLVAVFFMAASLAPVSLGFALVVEGFKAAGVLVADSFMGFFLVSVSFVVVLVVEG